MVTVRRILLGGIPPTLKAMQESAAADGLIADLAASFLNTPEREIGSIVSTAQARQYGPLTGRSGGHPKHGAAVSDELTFNLDHSEGAGYHDDRRREFHRLAPARAFAAAHRRGIAVP
jgi:hypothetical protein